MNCCRENASFAPRTGITGRFLCTLLTMAALGAANAAQVEIIRGTNNPHGVNIALRANGGRFDLANPPAEDKFNVNVNDGYTTEWRAREKKFPQDVVFSFAGGGTATVDRVVINTLTKDSANNTGHCPNEIELSASLGSASTGFKKITDANLTRKAGRHLITFEPTPIRHLRVRFKSSYGQVVQFSEVEVYEAPGQPSVRGDRQLNIAAAGNGGSIVRFTDPSSDSAWLLDGQARGWHTDNATFRPEIIFSFRDDREALIDRIAIDPKSQHAANTMARTGKILLSNKTPLEGFEEVAEFTIEKDGKEISVPIGRTARFVKLAVTGNHGGKNTSLAEVRILEGTAEGYRSVLSAPEPQLPVTNAIVSEGDAEAEPNSTVDTAGLLFMESPLRGRIKPLGDEDYFTLEIDKPKFPEVSIELRGRPYIRTSLTLHQGDRIIASFDPTNAAGESAIIKFPVTQGSYGIRVFEPPTSMLVVYDASSSMRESMTNLRVAVDAYVENLRPSVLVNLIRFDSKFTVVLPEFTSDKAKLKEAVAQNFAVGSGTAVFDAVNKGFQLLNTVPGNRAMIVMTDGSDSSSKTNYANFWKLVESSKVRLYTVGFGDEMDLLADKLGTSPRRMMDHIAMATHGRSFMTETAEELKGLYETIGEEIRQASEYSLLAFWGEEPPKAEAQASATEKRRKVLGGGGTGMNFFLIGIGALVVIGLIVGVIIAARQSTPRGKRVPTKRYGK